MSVIHHSRFVRPVDIVRVLLGWGAFAALLIAHPILEPPVSTATLGVALAVIVGVIVVCAFGVVKQAEALAHRLGDPYGSLVLTLSIVVIEVVLIAAVMLGPGQHPTIARDSVMAVAMIIMNLVVGLSLLVGGMRHGGMRHNRTGTSAYLSMVVVLVSLGLALPALIGIDGAYTPGQEIPVVSITIVLYAFFLFRQMGAQAGDFREVDERLQQAPAGPVSVPPTRIRVGVVIRQHRREILARLLLLIATVIPIVLLSHDMAALLDDGLGRIGAPIALAGVLIAMIVFLPESITAIRAAFTSEVQRVSNLCHGALVSTVGLTVPAVLIIGLATGQTVILAESPANLLMLAITVGLSVTTFAAERVTAMHGMAHLAVFAIYVMILLQ